jgi:hypothetical protein
MHRLVTVAVTLLCLVAHFASAEPVTLPFIVQIEQRCGAGGCELFRPSFRGTVTFDDGVTDEFEIREGSTFGIGFRYGRPTFSRPPLDFPPIPADIVWPDFLNFTEASRALELDGTIRYILSINEVLVSATGASWSTSLSAFRLSNRGDDDSPSLSPTQLLTSAGPDGLGYFFSSNGITYSGSAFPDAGAAPVPEPSTLLLGALGAAVVAKARRRKQSTPVV